MPQMQDGNGRLFEVPDDQVAQRQQDLGWTVAAPEATQQLDAERTQYQQHGGANQQALGLAETFVRNATLGGVKGLSGTEEEQRARANETADESPGLNFAASAAPAVAAGLATGGAGLGVAGTLAAEGTLGGLGGVGQAADEAFKHDQELSAEAALGSFGGGFLLGGAVAGGAMLAGKAVSGALGAARNRFVEASSKVAREADTAAFEAAGVVRPVTGLSDALEDPVAAAKVRKAGAVARPKAQEQLAEALGELEAAHGAAARELAAPIEPVPAARNAPVSAAPEAPASTASAGDQFADDSRGISSKSGRRHGAAGSESWKGTPKAAASVDRRIAAYGDDPEFQDLLQAKAAENRRTPFGPGKERELWELQKDVLEENSARFPKVADTGEPPPVAAAAPAPEPAAVTAQRYAIRDVLDGARKGLEPLGTEMESGTVARLFESLDRAETPEQMFRLAQSARRSFDEALDATADPAAAKVLKRYADQAREVEHSAKLFGAPADEAMSKAGLLRDLSESSEALRLGLDSDDFLSTYGLKSGEPVRQQLETYLDRMAQALNDMKGAEAKAGLKAIGKVHKLLDGEMSKVAAENQINALRQFAGKPVTQRPTGMGAEFAAEGLDALVGMLPGGGAFGIARKLFKYRKHILRLAGSARGEAEQTADAIVGKSAGFQRAKALIDKRKGASGAVGIGDASPVDLSGKSLRDLGALDDSTTFKQETLEALRTGKGGQGDFAADFASSGRVSQKGQAEQGIQVELTSKGPRLVDGRHRLMVGREKGLETVHGQVYQGKRAPGKKPIYEGPIPIGGAGSESGAVNLGKGRNFSLGDVAKSPMGAVTAAGGLLAAGKALSDRRAMFSDIGDDPAAAYQRVKGAVEMLTNEPDRLAEALASEMGDIPEDAPELLEAVNQKALRAVGFLQSKLPPAFEFSLLHPDGPLPSQSDILEMSLYWRGVTQPRSVLAALADGSAMPEEVEAFRAVNPTWFAEVQEALQTRVAEASRAGETIGAYRVAQLETLLDMPGKLDPAFSDSVADIVRVTSEVQEQAQKPASYIPAPKAGARTDPKGQSL